MAQELSTAELDKYLHDERWKVLQRARISSLYHQKRERFYDGMDRAVKAIAVVGGAVIAGVALDAGWRAAIAGAVSVSATLALVYGLSSQARRHADFAREYHTVIADLDRMGPWLEQKQINEINARISLLEAKEPASLPALVVHCENELSIANGHPERVVPLSLLQRMGMHFIAFNPNPTDVPKESKAPV